MRWLLLSFFTVTTFAITLLSFAHADRVIQKEVLVSASQLDVWNAWTTSEGVQTFFAPRANVELKAGGAYEMYFRTDAPAGVQGSEGCVILSFHAPDQLIFTWNAPPELPEVRGKHTQVAIQLKTVGKDQVQVILTHSGWGSSDQWDQAFAYFVKAWDVVLSRLQRRFESGPLDWSAQSGR